jgi:hypothetical protein
MPSPRVKLSEPLPLRKVVAMLGWTGKYAVQRLRRRMERIELATGKRVLTRQGAGKLGTRYFLTMAALREHMPEMFDKTEELADSVKQVIKGFEDSVERAEEKSISRHKELEHKLRSITARVATLERRVNTSQTAEIPAKRRLPG